MAAIGEGGSLKQFCGGRDLEKAAALRRDRGDEIRTSFLWCEPHLRSINERPVAKASYIASPRSGA